MKSHRSGREASPHGSAAAPPTTAGEAERAHYASCGRVAHPRGNDHLAAAHLAELRARVRRGDYASPAMAARVAEALLARGVL